MPWERAVPWAHSASVDRKAALPFRARPEHRLPTLSGWSGSCARPSTEVAQLVEGGQIRTDLDEDRGHAAGVEAGPGLQ